MFFYKNLKNFFYIFLAVTATSGFAYQLSNYYLSKQSDKHPKKVGYLITNGEQVIVKKINPSLSTFVAHGETVLSGESVVTLSHSVVFEFKNEKHRLRILPNSEVLFKKNGAITELYLSYGEVVAVSTLKLEKDIVLYALNDKQEYDLKNISNEIEKSQTSAFKMKSISLTSDEVGQKLNLSWDPQKTDKSRWIEFRAGADKNNLNLIKSFPYEQGSFSELWTMPEFYWQVAIKEDDIIIENTEVGFWKNEFNSKINLIYPADKEVVNNILEPDNFILKWSKAYNVDRVKVQLFKAGQQIAELDAGRKNQISFKPKEYGFYYWRVLNLDHSIVSENRGFYFAPIANGDNDILIWDEKTENTQFYYTEPVLYLKWNKIGALPVAKYKVTLTYFQDESAPIRESFFVETEEINVKLKALSPVKVKIEPYNNKMQILGKTIENEVKLVSKSVKKMLTFKQHQTTKNKEIITDRDGNINFDSSSISPIYQYVYEIYAENNIVVKKGVLNKGEKLNMQSLPTGYYGVVFQIQDKALNNFFVSQSWKETDKTRGPASSVLNLKQAIKTKLIPPVDYNLDDSQIITPQVHDVEIKN